jgi:hypothetical protein
VFYYNGAPTANIAHDASAATVQAAIEKHQDSSSVNVTFLPSRGATVCQSSPTNVVRIEFDKDFGPLPRLSAYTSLLPSGAVVSVSADGTTSLTDSEGTSYTSVNYEFQVVRLPPTLTQKVFYFFLGQGHQGKLALQRPRSVCPGSIQYSS